MIAAVLPPDRAEAYMAPDSFGRGQILDPQKVVGGGEELVKLAGKLRVNPREHLLPCGGEGHPEAHILPEGCAIGFRFPRENVRGHGESAEIPALAPEAEGVEAERVSQCDAGPREIRRGSGGKGRGERDDEIRAAEKGGFCPGLPGEDRRLPALYEGAAHDDDAGISPGKFFCFSDLKGMTRVKRVILRDNPDDPHNFLPAGHPAGRFILSGKCPVFHRAAVQGSA